ncbi:hypothetical protein EJ05DRAFT_126202 [Pseudovirgaria hyperparasitica]|uniref:Peptidase S28 n=1 Tax=Pseudovirgaria hyperparasitica TaxID=470096 RepID=A0A6A6VZM9_9PEZI|nr:uncharacterized protein EJ05DRAFT_126202 [Pseudovirgaria hyperparasitica]KAF2755204.1 hypothetical protein EJ05DRAFT_126202 [Pseudovirgaria hyperparasitica]
MSASSFSKLLETLSMAILVKRAAVAAMLGVTLFGTGSNALGGINPNMFRYLADYDLNPDGSPLDQETAEVKSMGIAAADNKTITPEYVELPLNHFGTNAGTFKNRFWVTESGYKPGAARPVFVYDFGEGDAEPAVLEYLQNSTHFFNQMVEAYGGIGILWEHRFYGNSTPVEINLDTPPEAFKFLTTEQALADVKAFADQFSRKNYPNVDFTPNGAPWVFIGGSYAGMRAAFMRKLYPETIVASYASSAPVQASVDMSFFYDTIYHGMNAYGYSNCTADIHAAIMYMDKEMEDEEKAAALKQKFLGRGAEKNPNPSFGEALTIPTAFWHLRGMDKGLHSLCTHISTDPATNKTAPAEGWAASKGPEFTVDRWASWPIFVRMVNDLMTSNCEGPVPKKSGTPDCNLNHRFSNPVNISWIYQYCTQWGFLQSANLGERQIVSKWNSLQHQMDICHRQFPSGIPKEPETDKTNQFFGGWKMRPSNVYWSGGQYDPWGTLSPLSTEDFAPHLEVTQNIPECNVATSEDTLFGYTLANAQHCYDFKTTPLAATSRGYFTSALDKWLKCWEPKKPGYPRYEGKP